MGRPVSHDCSGTQPLLLDGPQMMHTHFSCVFGSSEGGRVEGSSINWVVVKSPKTTFLNFSLILSVIIFFSPLPPPPLPFSAAFIPSAFAGRCFLFPCHYCLNPATPLLVTSPQT